MSIATPAIAAPGKYLTVVLDHESYGIPVLKVREIIRLQKITSIPQMPAFVKGVINLRGRVVPVIDLRTKFVHRQHQWLQVLQGRPSGDLRSVTITQVIPAQIQPMQGRKIVSRERIYPVNWPVIRLQLALR